MTDNKDLPKGWVRRDLCDLLTIIRGVSFPKDAKSSIAKPKHVACLRTANVQQTVEWDDLWFVHEKYVRRNEQFVQIGDILISTANSLYLVGKVSQVTTMPYKTTLGAFISLLRAPKELCQSFFYYVLSSTEIQSSIRECASTTTNISNVSTRKLAKIQLPLPPLPEQHRIVSKIEELFSDLDAGVSALEVVRQEIKRYRQAVLKHAFEGKLTAKWREENKDKLEPASKLLERIAKEREKQAKGKKQKKLPPLDSTNLPKLPEGWEWSRVVEIGALGEQTVLTGPFGSTLGKSDFISAGVPLLTIGCLTEQGVKLDKAFYISTNKAEELKRYKLSEGDLLFSRSASVGRVGYATQELEGSLINYHLMRLRLDAKTISPQMFIYYVRGAKTVNDYLRYVNHGATRDGINTANLLSMPVAIPSFKEQKQIVSEIEQRFSIADQAEKIVEQTLKQSQRLRQSILKRAFEGKLVPQDPNDEPAEKMLERIKRKAGK